MDTAQALAPAETDRNAQFAEASAAFKAFEDPGQPRDESGKFASREPAEAEEAEEEAGELAEPEDAEAEADEADEEEAEPAHPLPPSWGAEDQQLWETLPPDAQARIAAREGERDRGLNLKLQETANVRKASELAAKEAQTRRDDYLAALETVEGLFKAPEPDPRAFGHGTQQYNEAAYLAAHRQWQQNAQVIAQFTEQRETLKKQAAEEADKAFSEWKQHHEAQFAPKLLADVPDLKDATKAGPVLDALMSYAVESGIPQEVFAEDQQDQITSAQLLILWKAQQFDKLRTAKAEPRPKQAGPAIRPGVSSTRSGTKAAQTQKAFDRLDREGSIAAGAAYFKTLT